MRGKLKREREREKSDRRIRGGRDGGGDEELYLDRLVLPRVGEISSIDLRLADERHFVCACVCFFFFLILSLHCVDVRFGTLIFVPHRDW